MLTLRPISKARPDHDYNLFIVRSAKSVPRGFIHVPELSPSPALFRQFLEWKKQGKWPGMWPEYTRLFAQQFNTDMAMLEKINWVADLLRDGKSVQMVCYCPDIMHCHRGIFANLYEQLHYEVVRE